MTEHDQSSTAILSQRENAIAAPLCDACEGRGHYKTPRLRFPESPHPDPINGPCRSCNGSGVAVSDGGNR